MRHITGYHEQFALLNFPPGCTNQQVSIAFFVSACDGLFLYRPYLQLTRTAGEIQKQFSINLTHKCREGAYNFGRLLS